MTFDIKQRTHLESFGSLNNIVQVIMALDCEFEMNTPISHTLSMRTLCTPVPTATIPSFSFS
ncbi:hypothetical protein P692DRAFT_2044095 [Suillus brevipes Sb2]|nr:hypothetical protein P692DRAFT_2044095 [Suillus brevipes Sb2]